MARTLTNIFGALVLGVAATASVPAVADAGLACSSLLASVAEGNSQPGELAVVKTEKLYRWQQKPWARIPEGVALYVRAPQGTTAADLHNRAAACARATSNQQSPLCVKGASIQVHRAGGLYVLSITSSQRGAALDIQRRAEQL